MKEGSQTLLQYFLRDMVRTNPSGFESYRRFFESLKAYKESKRGSRSSTPTYIPLKKLNDYGFSESTVESIVNTISYLKSTDNNSGKSLQLIYDKHYRPYPTPLGFYSEPGLTDEENYPMVINISAPIVEMLTEFFEHQNDIVDLVIKVKQKKVYIKNREQLGISQFNLGQNKRFERLVEISRGKKAGKVLQKKGSLQNLSSEIREVNKKILQDLSLKKPLIVNPNRSGYEINSAFYRIEIS